MSASRSLRSPLTAFLRHLEQRSTARPVHPAVCHKCLRPFSTTTAVWAGHNKWSKTKHIKAVTDKKKTAERTEASNLIALYSRLYGDDVKFNPSLANAIAAAKKASIPQAVIEKAIARGQGRSTTGAALESMTLEFLFPPDVAVILDVETENKNRSLQDLRAVAKDNGAINGASAFYFTRRGRTVFGFKEDAQDLPSLSEVLDEAIEHEGTEDVEELPDGNFVVWTESSMLAAVTHALSEKFGALELRQSEIVWSPNEDTQTAIDSEEVAQTLESLFSGLKEHQEVKGLYANVRKGSISDEEWDGVERSLDL